MSARTEEEKEDDVRFTTSLAGLAVALLLAVVGLISSMRWPRN